MNRDPKDRIDRFSHQYEFLSNFYPCKIIITTEKEGQLSFWSAEAAFQAMKTTDSDQRRKFCYIKDAGEAKEMGKRVRIRPDFTFARIPIMEYIVSEKFAPDRRDRQVRQSFDRISHRQFHRKLVEQP